MGKQMLSLLFMLLSYSAFAQQDSSYREFRPIQLVVPGVLIVAGVWGTSNDWMDNVNSETRDELQEDIDRRISVDDFSQYAPIATIGLFNLCGVEAVNKPLDQAILLGTSTLLMGSVVLGMKEAWSIRRPDGSTCNSFPSGHTATAFMGAHLLAKEYWDEMPWVVAGCYLVAGGTGFFRMYNNRHWLTDVLCGAGIGMLSVESAYWLHPFLSRKLRKGNSSTLTMMPFYQFGQEKIGLTACLRL